MPLLLLGCIDPHVEPRVGAATVDSCTGVPDDAACDDQNPCTLVKKCKNEVCVGTPQPDGMPCTDANQCTSADTCQAGVCIGIPRADGSPCTDLDPCTEPDVCVLGLCTAGGAKVCDDGISCTMDHCVTGVGCQFDVGPMCPDGDAGGMSDAAMDLGGPDLGADVPGNDTNVGDAPAPDIGGQGGAGGAGGSPNPDGSSGGDSGRDADAGGDASGDADGPVAADSGRDADAAGDLVDADAGDLGGDTNQDGAVGLDAAADASDDAGAPEAGARQFEVRGGACVCDIAAPPPPFSGLLGIGVASLLLVRRRRRCRR